MMRIGIICILCLEVYQEATASSSITGCYIRGFTGENVGQCK